MGSNVYDKFNELVSSEKYDEAIQVFQKCKLIVPPSSKELVNLGDAIFMSSGDSNYDLNDVETAYLKAIELDENYVSAYMELGYFYLNTLDKPSKAKSFFEKAFKIAGDVVSESICGIAQCIGEIKSCDEGLDYLEQNKSLVHNHEKFQNTIEDIKLLGK